MSNYTVENLVPVTPGSVPAKTLAVKIGGQIFTMSGGGSASAFDLVKVTGYTEAKAAYSAVTQIVVSGLTEDQDLDVDFSAYNGTYTPTAETAEEADPLKRIYKHATANRWIKHDVWDPDGTGEGTGYWLMVTNLSYGIWDADLSKTSNDLPLASGTANWENMNWGATQSATLAVTTTNYPAVSFSLTVQKVIAYTDANYIRTFTTDNTTVNLTGTDYVPVIGGMDIVDNATSRLVLHVSDSTGEALSGIVFCAPLSAESASALTGQPLTTSGTVTYQTESGIPCAYFNGSSYIQSTDRSELAAIRKNNAFTVSVWAKITGNTTGTNGIFAGGEWTIPYGIVFSGSYICGEVNGNRDANTDYSNYKNIWTHLCWIGSGGTATLYINGTQIATSTYNTIDNTTQALRIATRNSDKITGYLAMVRVFDRAITAQELAALAAEFTPTT